MQIYQFDFGELTVSDEDHIVIGKMADGTVVDETAVCRMNELANSIYKGKPWIYISDREFSYSLDPMLYQKELKVEENMVGFIVVAHRPLTRKVAEFESTFKNKKYAFVVCSSLSEATDIARKMLSQLSPG